MKYKERIPEELFQDDGHYLGRPAAFHDRIIQRRLNLVEAIPNFTGKDLSLLEIGCGSGASLFMLSAKMKTCVGLEITNEYEAEFNDYKTKQGIQNCTFQVADVVESKPAQQFDRIISFEVIEHLSDESGMQYYFDALKDDGILALSVPNKWWIFETHGAKLPLLPWNRVPFFSWLPRPIHEKFANARIYTKQRIQSLLEAYGFEVIDSQYIMAPMDVLPSGMIKDWVINTIFNADTTAIPFKSTSIFVVARKRRGNFPKT